MASVTDIGGDVVAAGGAIAGLMLVYMGALSSGFSTYDAKEKAAVRKSFRRRAWFAFAGLVLNSLAIPFGLGAKAFENCWALAASLGFLVIGLGWLIVVAVLTVREIK